MNKLRRDESQMHRIASDGRPDWEQVEPAARNRHQRIAAATRGIVTTANGLTILGTVFVMNGLLDFANGQQARGLCQIATGRGCDLLDGKEAERTGTKSGLGAGMDATADMAQLAVALPVLAYDKTLPMLAVASVAAPKTLNTLATLSAKMRRKRIDTAGEGKIATAAIWGGIVGFIGKATIGRHAPDFVDTALEVFGYVGTVGGSAIGLPATLEYSRVGFTDYVQPQSTVVD